MDTVPLFAAEVYGGGNRKQTSVSTVATYFPWIRWHRFTVEIQDEETEKVRLTSPPWQRNVHG